jgi:hypothetical protein
MQVDLVLLCSGDEKEVMVQQLFPTKTTQHACFHAAKHAMAVLTAVCNRTWPGRSFASRMFCSTSCGGDANMPS